MRVHICLSTFRFICLRSGIASSAQSGHPDCDCPSPRESQFRRCKSFGFSTSDETLGFFDGLLAVRKAEVMYTWQFWVRSEPPERVQNVPLHSVASIHLLLALACCVPAALLVSPIEWQTSR
ncbi:hypothetical protein BDK51DRAFT_51789 [Blyttiomyces helicus]|uniref:Uncharacterized protein n=1 Tax=Blyttiomyces helicus TaxID=388810 RepID=A0A4V1IRQ5_9FUNG|nr:hypothetical protein BDK51DRAFT_51789 [Blyttiomyces helicus]|eukprot:RKO90877.1 hypothetical protein BDK51DRAFT_51789 [Blyttiomyces helicus]